MVEAQRPAREELYLGVGIGVCFYNPIAYSLQDKYDPMLDDSVGLWAELEAEFFSRYELLFRVGFADPAVKTRAFLERRGFEPGGDGRDDSGMWNVHTGFRYFPEFLEAWNGDTSVRLFAGVWIGASFIDVWTESLDWKCGGTICTAEPGDYDEVFSASYTAIGIGPSVGAKLDIPASSQDMFSVVVEAQYLRQFWQRFETSGPAAVDENYFNVDLSTKDFDADYLILNIAGQAMF